MRFPGTSFLFAFALLLMPAGGSGQVTCPDLTGRYVIQGEDGRVYLTIEQKRCAVVSIEWTTSYLSNKPRRSTHTLSLDGAFHRDRGWFGASEDQLTSAQFRGSALELVAKPLDDRSGARRGWRMRLELLPNRDLCSSHQQDGYDRWSASIAGRMSGSGRQAEEAAAARSRMSSIDEASAPGCRSW
jgi:hypothetical protein